MWAINKNDIVEMDGRYWLVSFRRSFNGQMDLVRFGDEGVERASAHQLDVTYVQHRPMSAPATAGIIGKRKEGQGVSRGDVVLRREPRSGEAVECVVKRASPNGGGMAVARGGKAGTFFFSRPAGLEVVGHEEIEPRGGRFRAEIAFDAVPDGEKRNEAAGFLGFLEGRGDCLFFAGLSVDGRVYDWDDIEAFNRDYSRRCRTRVDDPETIFPLVREAAAKGKVVRVAYSDSEEGMVIEIRPDELAYYVETGDMDAFADIIEGSAEEYDYILCQNYRDDDEWEDGECDPVFRIGEWAAVETEPGAKPVSEFEAAEYKPVRRGPARLAGPLDEQEVREIGYDRVAVYRCERWFIDSVSEGGLASLHRIGEDGSTTRVEVAESFIGKPNDARAVKDYLEASASTFCGDTCPECGTRIRMKDVTWKRVKVAPADEACGVEHQDKGETSWKWTCPGCGREGGIDESYPLCPLTLPYEVGDKVSVGGEEYVVVGGDAARGAYHVQKASRGDGDGESPITYMELGAGNWFEG